MPAMIRRGLDGDSRRVPVWHVAQLRPTSGTRSLLYVVPMGRDCGAFASKMKPSRSYPSPGRLGSLSAKTTGSTRQIA